MPIPLIDQGRMRSSVRQTINPRLNVFPPIVVATAVVSATPASYPIGQISVTPTSGWSNIKIGQAVRIHRSTGEEITWGVVRKTPTSNILYIDGKSRGDSGRATLISYLIQSGDLVTIYSVQPMWGLLSRIFDGAFYKKFDIPYDGSGSNPNPVVNIGQWQVKDVNENTGVATVSLSAANSFAWAGKTLSSYLWTLPVEATIVSGTLTSSSLIITLPEGFYTIRCAITDSGGASFEGMRPIWVNGAGYLPLSDSYGMEISSDRQDRQGREMSIKIYGDLPNSLWMPGFPFAFTETAKYDGQSLTSGIGVTNFVGFNTDELLSMDAYQGEKAISLNIKAPFKWLDLVPMVSQAIIETASPSSWEQVGLGLGVPDFIAWYVLKHHTTYLEQFDFYRISEAVGETDPPRKKNWGLNGSTVSDYLKQTASIIAGNIGNASDGSCHLWRDPIVEDNTYRTALDQRMTILPQDLQGAIEIAQPFHKKVGQVRAFALLYNGEDPVAYASIAPGYAQAQAPGKQDEESLIIKPPDGQSKTNQICGHLWAKANNPTPEIGTPLTRNYDIFDPAKIYWWGLDIPAEYNPRGVAYQTRMTCVSVDRGWENINGSWVKNVTPTFEAETFGQPGETLIMSAGEGNVADIEEPEITPDDFSEFFGSFAIAWTGTTLGRTFDGETWAFIGGNMSGTFNDVIVDRHSPYALSGYATGNLGAWCATTDATHIYIYYSQSILTQNPSWTLQKTITTTADVDGTVKFATSATLSGNVVIAYNEDGVVRTYHTSNNGTTWTGVAVGDTFSNPDAAGFPVGIALDGDNIICSGQDSGSYYLYYTTNIGGAFSKVTGSEFSDVPFATVELASDGKVYCETNHQSINVTPPAGVVLSGSNWLWTDAALTIDEVEGSASVGGSATSHMKISFPGLVELITASMTFEAKYLSSAADDPCSITFGTGYDVVGEWKTNLGVIDTTNICNEGFVSYNLTGANPADITNARYLRGEVTMDAKANTPLFFPSFTNVVQHGTIITTGQYIEQEQKLWRVANYSTGGATWTDITPAPPTGETSVFLPRKYYALSIDITNSSRIYSMMQSADIPNPDEFAYYTTTNQGTAWTNNSYPVDYYGLRRVYDYGIFWGHGLIDITTDGGDTLQSIFGDWATSMGDNNPLYRGAFALF